MSFDSTDNIRKIINAKMIDFFKNYKNQSLVFFSVLVIVLSALINVQSNSGSNGNYEQWINLTNQMFYGKQDFLFSYGPLFWLTEGVTSPFNVYTYWLAIIFLSILYACFWSAILTLSYKAHTYFFLAIAYFLFFGGLIFPTALILWPFILLTYLEFLKAKPVSLRARGLIFLGLLVGASLYIRFVFGVIALATFGSYFLSRLLYEKKIYKLVIFFSGITIGYIFVGLLIFHDKNSLVSYLILNKEMSFGNSVDMTLNVDGYEQSFFIAALVPVFFNAYLILRRPILLLTVNVLLLIFFKLGFSRVDHYLVYFVIPVSTLALVMIFDKSKLGQVLFVLIMGCLYYISSIPSYPGAVTKDSLKLPVDFEVGYTARMQNAYVQFKINADVLKKVGTSTVDVYPYNNEYMFANNMNYWHRPVFQNYMTLTPALDEINQKFFESMERPKFVLWTPGISCVIPGCNVFDGFDGKFSLNEDPLTTSAILQNYHIVDLSKGKEGMPIMLLEENHEHTIYSDSLISEQIMQFGEWYKVPRMAQGVTKIIPNIDFTAFGRLKNLLFRGGILMIKYKMVTGEIREYRLNILNSRSGIWVSPLLDDFALTGDGVDSIMFEVHSLNYFKPMFKSKWISVPIQSVYTRMPVFDQVLNQAPSFKSEVWVNCDGSIDSVNGISLGLSKGLLIDGWLTLAANNGATFDKTFLTLTSPKGARFFVSTRGQDRQDVAAAFKQPVLSLAGYKALLDLSKLQGPYTLGLAGMHKSILHNCSNFSIPLTVEK